jgi:hypothetical protein
MQKRFFITVTQLNQGILKSLAGNRQAVPESGANSSDLHWKQINFFIDISY